MNLLNCVLFLVASGLVIFFVGRIFPRKWIRENRFPFKSFNFEKNGKIYEKLKIKRWKTKLPDASLVIGRIFPKFLPKKRINIAKDKQEKIAVLIKESCVAESTHLFSAFAGLFCVKIWKYWGTIVSFAWLVWNMLFVIIQRYNRPRLIIAYTRYTQA